MANRNEDMMGGIAELGELLEKGAYRGKGTRTGSPGSYQYDYADVSGKGRSAPEWMKPDITATAPTSGAPSPEQAVKKLAALAANPNPTDVRSSMIAITAAARADPSSARSLLRAAVTFSEKADLSPGSRKIMTSALKVLTKQSKQTDKSMSGIDELGEYLEKSHTTVGHPYAHVGEPDPDQEELVEDLSEPIRAAFEEVDMVKTETDGKPGESLAETDIKELKATHNTITAQLKKDPSNKGLQARYKAIDGEIRKRGKHDPHAPPQHIEKAQPSEESGVSPEKAKQILRDGEVHGRPLTDAQRGMFGAIAGKAEKSMSDGIKAIGEYFEKGTGATLAATVTSAPPANVSDTGALSGDNSAGKGGMPGEDPSFTVSTEADGDEATMMRHTTGYGVNPMSSGDADAAAILRNDSANGGYMKSVAPDGTLLTPARQLEQDAHQRAVVQRQLEKSEYVTVVGADPKPEPEPAMQMSKSWRQGDLVSYTDFSDLAASDLAKSETFYHGAAPNPLATGKIRSSTLCKSGHVMSAILTACDVCGDGSVINGPGSQSHSQQFQKSQSEGLRPVGEEYLVLPSGTRR